MRKILQENTQVCKRTPADQSLACDEGLVAPIDHFAMAMSFANIQQILDHLDSKFELTKLFGKDGNFIKVINNE